MKFFVSKYTMKCLEFSTFHIIILIIFFFLIQELKLRCEELNVNYNEKISQNCEFIIVTLKKLEMSERDKLMLIDKKVNIYLLLYI